MDKLNFNVDAFVTVEECARLFCSMDNFEQADFFNEIAEVMKSWPNGYLIDTQFANICGSKNLRPEGRLIMEKIGEYAYNTSDSEGNLIS